jgi:dienelactone hydrolase
MKRAMWRSAAWIVAVVAVSASTAAGGNPATAPGPIALAPAWLQPPAMTAAEGFDRDDGIRAMFFDGVPYQGKPTRVFAWYGAPKVEPGKKVPAMVLIHGGGGTAFADWVKLWVGRGYAAIAMDTCGCVPLGKYGDWKRHEHGGPPGWGGFEQVDGPAEEQWPYHAVSSAILAHSLVRSFPEVDAERVGVTGISWGGYLTCIVAGLDDRFRFAAPVYGCGFLGENSCWLGEFDKMGEDRSARWLSAWDPSAYLPQATMPMLWVTGTNDFAYPMDSLQKSYRLPKGPRTLCITVRMPHGHNGPGEKPEEIRAFADSILKDGKPLAKVTGHGRREDDGRTAWAGFESAVPVAKAELVFTKDSGEWQQRKWEAQPATVDSAAKEVSAALPEGATVYYLNLIDDRGLVVSSEHEVVGADGDSK